MKIALEGNRLVLEATCAGEQRQIEGWKRTLDAGGGRMAIFDYRHVLILGAITPPAD